MMVVCRATDANRTPTQNGLEISAVLLWLAVCRHGQRRSDLALGMGERTTTITITFFQRKSLAFGKERITSARDIE